MGYTEKEQEKDTTQMESNKDEATRAKEIAESKFIARDNLDAREVTLEALNLYTKGNPHIYTAIDVTFAALTKRKGETYWYGVLGVDPLADDDTVRERYRKLARMLHPDNNTSFNTDVAYKLILEAWSVLSDKTKRAAYDEKINVKELTQHARTQEGTAKEHVSNPFCESMTFLKTCHRCRIWYEYSIVYLNRKLKCKTCKAILSAVEIAPPDVTDIRPAPPVTDIRVAAQKTLIKQQLLLYYHRKFILKRMIPTPIGPISRTSGVSSLSQAKIVVRLHEKVKRQREEEEAAMKMEVEGDLCNKLNDLGKDFFSGPAKRRRGTEDSSLSSHDVVGASNSCKSSQGNFESSCIYKTINSAEVVSHNEHQNLLMEKAINDISKKLSEMETNPTDETAVKESGNDYQKANGKEDAMVKVNNEDAIAKATADNSMAEDNGEELISDMRKLGEDKEGNNKDIQK
ncbi:uncharacterized protein LOC130719699 [Lotus japonicus]|uniref:uncharacterized protein LOC130719699 n=1 Tax=Lotus japonicus TaxID=34305 RepID=UPI0025874DD7|nr:uncharacterized protein LOC130719699 [Lotus japonicus]